MTDSEGADRVARLVRRRQPHDFDDSYAGTPPWDIGRPQPAFLALARAGLLVGPVLDVGCGTGEHALMASGIGLEATGVDTASTAIEIARRKASERALDARFVVHDALELASIGEQFGTVLDCGLFHVFEDEHRSRFVESLRSVLPPAGRYYMLCFSDSQPGDWGPRRVTEQEICSSFAGGWIVESIVPSMLELTINPEGAQAWFATVSRT